MIAQLLLVSPTAGLAHANLARAVPPPNSTVSIVPTKVELFFSEKVEPAFSTIKVTDERGIQVEEARAQVDPSDGKTLRIGLKPLTAGTYKVVWQVVSIDAHRLTGIFSFTVAR